MPGPGYCRSSQFFLRLPIPRPRLFQRSPPLHLAMVEFAVNNPEARRALLAESLEDRSGFLVWLKNTPAFDQVVADAKGKELVDRIGGKFPH